MSRVVVVGAGICGLTIAYRLQQLTPGVEITLLEQTNRPGGKVWTERHDGFQIEIGPNGFLDNKPSTMAMCQDLGLADQLMPASETAGRNRYLFLKGKLHRLPGGFGALLGSKLLSWRGKVQLLCEPLHPRRRQQSDESVEAFVRRRAGKEAAAVLADALVTGIYAGDPALLSVRAAFPRLAGYEDQYGSLFKGMIFAARQRRLEAKARGQPRWDRGGTRIWSFRQGLRLLVESLKDHLIRPPLFGVRVRRIEQGIDARNGSWIVYGEGQDCWPARAVVLACPGHQQAAVLEYLDRELADRISAITYNRLVVVALAYSQSTVPCRLDGFGFIAPQGEKRDLLGVQWCSSIFANRAPGGAVLLRAMCGGWNRPEIAGWDDARLLEAVRAEFKLVMGIEAEPLLHRIIRWDRAIPQYHVGHLDRVAWIENRTSCYPGLFLAGDAYHGVGLNDGTEQAAVVAAQVYQYLVTSAPGGTM